MPSSWSSRKTEVRRCLALLLVAASPALAGMTDFDFFSSRPRLELAGGLNRRADLGDTPGNFRRVDGGISLSLGLATWPERPGEALRNGENIYRLGMTAA